MTSLANVQRAFTRICFDEEPRAEDLALLHSADERWLLYRRMVRARLFGMMRSGLPESSAQIGKERFDAAVSSYLAAHGPRTRFIREIVQELVDHALPGWEKDESLPAHLPDLVRYEATKWHVASLEWPTTAAVSDELDFEGVPVMNPTVQTLTLRHRVDKDPKEPKELAARHLMIVYRKPDNPRIYTYVLNPMGRDLFEAWRAPDRSFADGVRAVLAAHEREPDAGFIDGMAGVLADLVSDSVILGSRR